MLCLLARSLALQKFRANISIILYNLPHTLSSFGVVVTATISEDATIMVEIIVQYSINIILVIMCFVLCLINHYAAVNT